MPGPATGGTLRPMQTEPIHPAVRVGHVHLRVADLDRSMAFYRDALGLGVTAAPSRVRAHTRVGQQVGPRRPSASPPPPPVMVR